ncbi:inorganic phosphate transporter [Pseudactinotalea sp.]|uniref:inorganic phosphate transporter n=1 Tax=Pseudactinotalea sp. TaxID=1926260 RepID=UPI003B3B9D64
MATEAALLAVALGFALVTGINDGGALLAPGLRLPGGSVAVSLIAIAVATTTVPLVLGTRVAQTMLAGIVPAEATLVVTIGFCVAIAVVLGLSRAGLPTSLTLAVVGGLAGAGLGAGAAVQVETLVRVLGFGVLAPIAGALLAYLGSAATRRVRTRSYRRAVGGWHGVGFLALCLAYGMNDGQKVLVLFMLAAGTGANERLPLWAFAAAGAMFAVGALLGLPRVARTMSTGILAAGPVHVVVAESAAAVAVLASAAVGSPVSMTQAVTGGLVGAGSRDGVRRLRWLMIGRVAIAWVATLPAALILGAMVSLIVMAVVAS